MRGSNSGGNCNLKNWSTDYIWFHVWQAQNIPKNSPKVLWKLDQTYGSTERIYQPWFRKQGSVIILSLEVEAQGAALELNNTEIAQKDGVDKIIYWLLWWATCKRYIPSSEINDLKTKSELTLHAITVNQKEYINSISQINLKHNEVNIRRNNFPQRRIGKINWVLGMTRPEINLSVCELSSFKF